MGVLRAKVNGTWQDVTAAAPEEVVVGTIEPIAPETELWYDPNAVAEPAGEVFIGPDDPYASDPADATELWFDTDQPANALAGDIGPWDVSYPYLLGDRVTWPVGLPDVWQALRITDPGEEPGVVADAWQNLSNRIEHEGGTINGQLTVDGASTLNGPVTVTGTSTLNGDETVNGQLNMGTGDKIVFPAKVGEKLLLYPASGSTFGLGIESGTLSLFVEQAANRIAFKVGGTERARVTQDGILAATGPANGLFVGDKYHGWTYDGANGHEQLRSYQGSWSFRKTNGSTPGTETARVDDNGITIPGDGDGVWLNGGAGLLKKSGAGVVLRESSGGQQPRIENSDGSAGRDIIDTTNGDARYVSRAQNYGASVYARSLTINGIAAGLYLVEWGCTLVSPGDDWWSTELKMDDTTLGLNTAWSGGGHYWSGTTINRVNIGAGNHTFTVGGQATNGMGGYDLFTVKLTPTA